MIVKGGGGRSGRGSLPPPLGGKRGFFLLREGKGGVSFQEEGKENFDGRGEKDVFFRKEKK